MTPTMTVVAVLMGLGALYAIYRMRDNMDKPGDPFQPYGNSGLGGLTHVKLEYFEDQDKADRFHATLARIYKGFLPQALDILGKTQEEWHDVIAFKLFAHPDEFYNKRIVDKDGNMRPLNGLTSYYQETHIALRVFRDEEGEHMYHFGGAWSWELRNALRYRLLGLQEFEPHETDAAMEDLVNEYLYDPEWRFERPPTALASELKKGRELKKALSA